MSRETRKRRRLLLTLLAAGAVLWLGSEALRFSLEKTYSVDEFQYAHGAWKVARGEVIYRDFFEHHFPLVHQIMALVWTALDDNPHNIEVLRLAMLPFLALMVLAAVFLNRRWINRHWGHATGWTTAIVLLATINVQTLATEIRPDPIALAFFLAALAVLGSRRLSPFVRGVLSGALLTLSVWGSQKVLYYGVVFPAAFVADLIAWRRRSPRHGFLLGHPLAFALGSLAVLVPIALYLLITGSADDWFHWCLQWSFTHQEHYPSVSWVTNLLGYLKDHVALVPFAALGVWQSVRRLRGSRRALESVSPEVLLLGALVTTAASFVWQTAPYLYSLLPLTALLAIYAARGLVWCFRALRALAHPRPTVAAYATVLLVLLLAGELSHVRTGLARMHGLQNASQHEMLQEIAVMTTLEDCVYNITGNQVTRPAAHYFYFTDAVVRSLLADRLAREIPQAIVEKGCTVYTHDNRFESLPRSLQAFLLDHFQPLSRDLWIWGQRYVPAEGGLEDSFLAIRDARYYLEPAEALEQGELRIDGRPVTAPVVELGRGIHAVEYRGEARELSLLWLPRDEKPRPRVDLGIRGPALVPGGRGLPAGFEGGDPNPK